MRAIKLISAFTFIVLLSFSFTQILAHDDDEEATVHTEGESSEHRVTVEEVPYVSPKPIANVYFAEHFDNAEDVDARWTKSQAKKDGADEAISKYDGKWAVESLLKDGLKGDLGLVLKSKAKHAAISAMLDRPFHFTNRPLIVQYDVTFQNGQECGGAYLKLLSHETGMRLSQFQDRTPYTIMFGPDKCGNDQKLHFIFRHKNPLNGTITEKHAKKPSGRLDDIFKDNVPHLFTLMVRPDNTFDVSVDYKIINSGNLLEDFIPPVNPPSEIDDPTDTKPEDWDEREKIPDPEATKPEDWDDDAQPQIPDPNASKPDGWLEEEPDMIPDPTAQKPEDWDDDMDGSWEAALINNPACENAIGCGPWTAPMIENPAFKGKWRPPMIDNPNYRGKWSPRRISNPDFFEDKHPFNMASIGAIGFELWSMSDNIFFDNIIITDDKTVAEQWAAETFDFKRHKADVNSSSLWGDWHSPAHIVQRLSRWMNRSTWFWPTYGAIAFAPALLFLGFLVWWYFEVLHDWFGVDITGSWSETVRRWLKHKPNVVMSYLMYMSVPVTLYVWYLRSRVLEESVVNRLMRYTNENPWLWAVYVIVIGLPIVLIFTFCCGGQEKQQDKAAKAKKSDETEADDEPLIEEKEEAAGEEDEEEVEGEAETEEAAEMEEAAAEQDQAESEEAELAPKTSPRRRRARKD